MVMATCLAATAASGPCEMTCDGPGAGGWIGGNVAGEVVVDVGAGRMWMAAVAALRGLPQPVRTLATPSPRRLTSVRRSIPWHCGQVMMSRLQGWTKADGGEAVGTCAISSGD